MKYCLAILASLALTACLPHPPPPAPPYRAVGIAPAQWTLIIDDKHIAYIAEPGREPLLQPVPKVIIGIAGEIYQTPRIGVNIVHQPCTDGRTALTYPDTVQVSVDDRPLRGCGGL